MWFVAILLIGKTRTILVYMAQDSLFSTTSEVRFHRSGIVSFYATLSRSAPVTNRTHFYPCLTKIKLWGHEADNRSSNAEIKNGVTLN
jgi:hypothetical protein